MRDQAAIDALFPGFRMEGVTTSGTTIRLRTGGSGPALLLLHGYPQTHVLWHRIAPRLAGRYTVVAADLRGYGDSGKPETTADHAPYSKRATTAAVVSPTASPSTMPTASGSSPCSTSRRRGKCIAARPTASPGPTGTGSS